MSLCRRPYMQGILPFGCGQCTPCRTNRRRLWTHRIMLEAKAHAHNAFVTLTYGDDPFTPQRQLVPADLRNFIKRLRKAVPEKLRYFAVGEYGEKKERPHYHLALFGYRGCIGLSACPCPDCELLLNTWGKGYIHNGSLTFDSAAYVAGYVTKKMTNAKDNTVKIYLQGRYPEFARQSNKGAGGIGASALRAVLDALTTDAGVQHLLATGDVPSTLQHGSKKFPLGRYLRAKLRSMYGMPQKEPLRLQKFAQEMRELLAETRATQKVKTYVPPRETIISAGTQKVLQQETRSKIYRQRKTH